MAKQSINTLKNWFKRGLKPLETQFADWLDSYYHKDDKIGLDAVEGLIPLLDGIPDTSFIQQLVQLGIRTVANVEELQQQPGTGNNAKLVMVWYVGLFGYRPEGTSDGITTFDALGGGVWVLTLQQSTATLQTLADVLIEGNNAGGQIIADMADPVNPQDADTMAARDAAIEVARTSLVGGVPAAGDTLNKLYQLITAVGRPRGGWDASAGLVPASAANEDGDFWRITVGGTINGLLSGPAVLKPGDLLLCSADGATTANKFYTIQSNVDQASATVFGLVKLYSALTASNTDGSVTQAAVVSGLALKANIASPAFTGTPTAPAPAPGTYTQQLATTAFVQEEVWKVVDLGNIIGNVSIDLSTGRHFKMIQTGNVTGFTFINDVVGKSYSFRIERAGNYTFAFTSGKHTFPLGFVPALTDPTANGSSPAKAVDVLTAVCYEPGRLTVVIVPDVQNN